MKDLRKRAFEGLAFLFIGTAVLLFPPAWSLSYWQAWVFLAAFFGPILAITLYLMKYDPKLLERRMGAGPIAEKEKSQRIIQTLTAIAFVALFLISALDHRFSWSAVPLWAVILGNALVVLGLLVIFFVFKENTFTSGTVEVDPEQTVVDTGPYAYVRHPMYAGAFVMLLGTPPALDSWWGLLGVLGIVLGILWRLLEEEKFLRKNLVGYSEYCEKVRYRLIPFVW